MLIRCDDGVVREFTRAYCDGDRLPDGSRLNDPMGRGREAECVSCGRLFGVHSSKYLRPAFKAHRCYNPAAVALGRLGGKATGKRKARGDAQYYRDLQAKSAAKRRASKD